jgi:hypothetical protein
MYFTNALYDPSPDAAEEGAHAAPGAAGKTYGATASGGDAAMTVPHHAHMSAGDAAGGSGSTSGCVRARRVCLRCVRFLQLQLLR